MKSKHFCFIFLIIFASSCESKIQNKNGTSSNTDPKVSGLLFKARSVRDSSLFEAYNYAASAKQLALSLNDVVSMIDATLLMSESKLSQQEPELARVLALEAEKLATEAVQPVMIVKAWYLQARAGQRDGQADKNMLQYEEVISKTIHVLNEYPANRQLTYLIKHIYSNYCMISQQSGNQRRALAKLQKDEVLFTSFPEVRMNIYLFLSELYRNTGNYDSAAFYAEETLNMAKELHDTITQLKVIRTLANIHYNKGEYSKSLEMNHELQSWIQRKGMLKELALSYNNIASIYQNTGNLELSARYFIESLRLKDSIHDSAGIVVTLGNLSLVYKSWKNYTRALEYLQQALSLNLVRKNLAGVAVNYNNFGDLFYQMEAKDSAILYYTKALAIKKQLADPYGEIISLEGLGRSHLLVNQNFSEASASFNKAKQLAQKIQSEFWLANLDFDLAELSLFQKDTISAKAYLEAGLLYARNEKIYDLIQPALVKLIELNASQGNSKYVPLVLNELISVNDSIFNRDKAKVTSELLVRFETERIEKENVALKKDNEINMLKLHGKNLLLWSLIVILVVVIVSGGFMIWNLLQREKANKLLVKYNMDILNAESLKNRQQDVIVKNRDPLNEENEEQYSQQALMKRLIEWIEVEKGYQLPNLTLEDICKHINTNRTYLSTLINTHFKKNFHIFITDYRVGEARRLLADRSNDKYTIEEIGRQAGFGTKASFHRHFKDTIGLTPSYFRKMSGKTIE